MTDGDLRWFQWHSRYDDLESEEAERLEIVQQLLVCALDEAAPGASLTAVSVCAGQARDLLPVLINHPRGRSVSARLVEADPLNASFLHGALGSTDLPAVELVLGDGGDTGNYRGAVPADVVLLGGVFANIDSADAHRTVAALPGFCSPGAIVVWSSYGRRLPEAASLLAQLEQGPFHRHTLWHGTRSEFLVAAHRYTGTGAELPTAETLFSFS